MMPGWFPICAILLIILSAVVGIIGLLVSSRHRNWRRL